MDTNVLKLTIPLVRGEYGNRPCISQIQVDTFKHSENLLSIHARVIVLRDSQKAIIVGKGGTGIKQLGSAAREVFAHLSLSVSGCAFCTDVVYSVSVQACVAKQGALRVSFFAQSLERFFAKKVFLGLNVVVDSDWRTKSEALKRYGYYA
jgi:hypothetical protein